MSKKKKKGIVNQNNLSTFKMFQDPKPFESTSGKPIEAAGRLLIVNQEGAQAQAPRS